MPTFDFSLDASSIAEGSSPIEQNEQHKSEDFFDSVKSAQPQYEPSGLSPEEILHGVLSSPQPITAPVEVSPESKSYELDTSSLDSTLQPVSTHLSPVHPHPNICGVGEPPQFTLWQRVVIDFPNLQALAIQLFNAIDTQNEPVLINTLKYALVNRIDLTLIRDAQNRPLLKHALAQTLETLSVRIVRLLLFKILLQGPGSTAVCSITQRYCHTPHLPSLERDVRFQVSKEVFIAYLLAIDSDILMKGKKGAEYILRHGWLRKAAEQAKTEVHRLRARGVSVPYADWFFSNLLALPSQPNPEFLHFVYSKYSSGQKRPADSSDAGSSASYATQANKRYKKT